MQRAIVTIAFAALFAGATFSHTAETGRKKTIVVLYSFRTLLPINVDRDRGIRRALAEQLAQGAELEVEYLDLSRYKNEEYVRDWIALLQKKYGDSNVEVVIPVAVDAVEFTLAHRDAIFPDVPIVFCSVEDALAKRACAEPNVTGVVYHLGVDATLRSALDIYPKAKHLLVIGGTSPLDKSIRDLAASQIAQYEQVLNVEYLTGLPLPELLDRVAKVEPHTVVLMLSYQEDTSGDNYVTREVIEKISNACPAPVFGLWDTLLGHGITGGSLIQIETQGEIAGQMAARVLQGERASDIPLVGEELNQLMFDARQLQRLSIHEDILPEGSIVRYREPTFWESYLWILVAACTIVVLQSLLITALLFARLRRWRAEQALAASQELARQHRSELARVNRMTTVGELTASLAHEVNQPLSAIVSNAQAAIRLLRQTPPDSEEADAALHDIVGDGNRAAGILNRVRSLVSKESPTQEPLDLNGAVHEVIELAAPDAENRGIIIHKQLDDTLPSINGDKIELQQVIMNLLNNAAQAMQDIDPELRQVNIRTTHDAQFVKLTVEDSGIGLSDDQLSQIFAPFYTLKTGGMGMGLSISQSIVNAHRGEIWATQNANRGVTFHVRLPVASPDA
ncbi:MULTISPECIES: sensor histidine kinase [Pirellulaceae]|uniref:sensor histidine kinase n=1 Tax=Pirellulaceae TaxID=2691357 RepID=UPI001304A7C1|nr:MULTISPECIES: sensor histidine kinase [Pirellulaceae]